MKIISRRDTKTEVMINEWVRETAGIIQELEEDRSWEENLPEERAYECSDKATALIAEYSWPKVFEAWNNYFHEKCDTPDSVINIGILW